MNPMQVYREAHAEYLRKKAAGGSLVDAAFDLAVEAHEAGVRAVVEACAQLAEKHCNRITASNEYHQGRIDAAQAIRSETAPR